jgi:hypothetical protein
VYWCGFVWKSWESLSWLSLVGKGAFYLISTYIHGYRYILSTWSWTLGWRFSFCYYMERLLKIHWVSPGTFLVRRQNCIATCLHKSSMNTSESFYHGTVIKILPPRRLQQYEGGTTYCNWGVWMKENVYHLNIF